MLNEKNCPVGTILIDGEGRERKVLATTYLAFLQSYVDDFTAANKWCTWEEAEELGWEIKPVKMTVEEVPEEVKEERVVTLNEKMIHNKLNELIIAVNQLIEKEGKV